MWLEGNSGHSDGLQHWNHNSGLLVDRVEVFLGRINSAHTEEFLEEKTLTNVAYVNLKVR